MTAPTPPVRDFLDNAACDPEVTWTTGNVAEAFPGVFTTLGFSYVHRPMEFAFRRTFQRLGVYSAGRVSLPTRIEDQFWTVFSGWGAGNIDRFRHIAGLTPGTSASAVEKQLFGYVRPTTVDRNSYRRYPVIAVKAPWTLGTLPKRHDAMFARLRAWRLARLAAVPELDEDGCLALLADARARFESMMTEHMIVAIASSGLAERLAATLARAELPGLESKLLSGVGTDENEVAHDLWALAHDELALSEFLDRHGYHGPNEGQLSGVSWREDPAPVLARLADYRAIPADSPRAPRRRGAEQERVRHAAAAELAARTSPLRRRPVGVLTGLTARFLALREQGKAGYLLTFDVARAAARRLGEHLVARDVIAEPNDVFHLHYDDLRACRTGDQREIVAERRARYQERQQLRLPKSWAGVPEVVKVAGDATQDAAAGLVITGVAASGGVVQGRARVVRDPGNTELDDGDILVCETTDPGWVSLFLVAGGVVTDFGGLLSHGPIVARELGIPCVCGTEDGSTRIRDGQRIRVDGDRGTVEVLG
jgi:phosphohistidine swiveling domain-containing protein